MKFLPSNGCVSTTVWMHHLDANETHGEKVRWKLHKKATCCFKQILEAIPNKAALVRLLTAHLTNHPSETNKT